jgi:putative membrane protein
MNDTTRYLAGIALAFTGAVALAQSPASDQPFYIQAAEGGMAEVAAGKLAQSKGAAATTRDFGAQMVADHTKANTRLQALATSKKVVLPAELNAEHKEMKAKLEALSGAAFDAEYLKGQVADHTQMAALLQKEIDAGTDADAKAFAAETLPTVKMHLGMAQKLVGGHAAH